MRSTLLMGGTAAAIALGLAIGASGAGASPGDGRMGERGGPRMDFATLDANGDGRITTDEVEARADARFAEFDADGDGTVSRQEFIDHAMAQVAGRAGETFDRLDADGDGTLSRDALEARRPGPDIDRLMGRFDTDGDGAISQEEFDTAQLAFRERMEQRMGERGEMRGRMGGERGEHGEGRRGWWPQN